MNSLKNFLFAAVTGTLVCELISSGSYYFINIPGQASFTEFAGRIVKYFHCALEITISYLLVALAVNLVLIAAANKAALSKRDN
ncbi:hypothetical protein [Polynucleobacter necessarius]|uniref:hypothetical protein n=1 Tax=Polynucleobacter necessarius TaxID=576610 RepID=UPI000E09AC8E|nr:hypothetical protein [Polynucleobacter necessarius]HAT39842.1 hypothetical protein [Polynucleobacter sp.]